MAKMNITPCDKLTYKILSQYGCQTANQIRTCMNRWYEESYAATSIAASLRKMAADSRAASSDNGRGQKVYWITDYGKECAKDYD